MREQRLLGIYIREGGQVPFAGLTGRKKILRGFGQAFRSPENPNLPSP